MNLFTVGFFDLNLLSTIVLWLFWHQLVLMLDPLMDTINFHQNYKTLFWRRWWKLHCNVEGTNKWWLYLLVAPRWWENRHLWIHHPVIGKYIKFFNISDIMDGWHISKMLMIFCYYQSGIVWILYSLNVKYFGVFNLLLTICLASWRRLTKDIYFNKLFIHRKNGKEYKIVKGKKIFLLPDDDPWKCE